MLLKRARLGSALLMCGAVSAVPAFAQEAAVHAAAPAGQNQDAATDQLAEVVVTANKRSESSRDVPETVTVLTGGKLDQIGATNFQDFANYVPGLSSNSSGTGENEVVLRGVTTGSQFSSTVGIYLDESPVGSSSSYAAGLLSADVNVFDMSRLEVLSGPQGTLYGASTLGGLIKYVTMAPDLRDFGLTLQGDGSHTQNGALNHSERGMLNLPILKNHLALRLDGIAENDAGFVDDPVRGLNDVNASRTRGGRASLLGELSPEFSVRLTALQQKIDRNGASSVDRDQLTHQPIHGEYDQSALVAEPFDNRLNLYTGLVKWNMGWAELTSASGWQDISVFSAADGTPALGGELHTGNLIPYTVDLKSSLRKFNQEVRLASSGSKWLDWQLGTLYTLEHADLNTPVYGNIDNNGQLLNLLPLPVAPLNNTQVPILLYDAPSKYREAALFADITAHLTDRLDLTLGGRYSGNRQAFTQSEGGLLGLATTLLGANGSGGSHQDVKTYLINPRYRIDESSIVYGRFASGYRPGGPNIVIPPPFPQAPPTFNADTLWNYELGTKSTFLDHRAAIDFDVYYIDWSDIQLVVNSGGFNRIENGGNAQVRGAEFVGSYKIVRGLTLGGNASYSHAKLAEPSTQLDAAGGSALPLSPRFSAAITLDYSAPLTGWLQGTAGISDRFVGPKPSGFDGSTVDPQYWMRSYNIVDLRFGAQTQYVNVSLFLKNIFNKLGEVAAAAGVPENGTDSAARVTIVQPRTIGLTLTFGM
jgi:outer membrane receptor protein involved in Fe transport